MKTVLVVVDNNFPGDVRVDKELHKMGMNYNVIVLCRKKGHTGQENIEVFQIPFIQFKFIRGISDSLNALFWLHIPLFIALVRIRFTRKIDLVHVHDLPLFQTVCTVMHTKIKILDLHENYPEALKSWFKGRRNVLIKIKNKLLFSFNRWKKYEKRMVKSADFIIAVVDEMANRLKAENVPENKVLVINNYEFRSFVKFNAFGIFSEYLAELENSIVYVGNYGPHRGIDDVIKSLSYLDSSFHKLNFMVAGIPNNSDTQSWLNALVLELNLTDKVKFIGRVPAKSYNFILGNSYINVIPHKSNGHTENTIPHKLFQSFLSRKPLIVSSCAPLKRYVLMFDAGAVFEAENPIHLASVIDDVCINYTNYLKKSENAFNACYNGSYNWDSEANKLKNLYESLLN